MPTRRLSVLGRGPLGLAAFFLLLLVAAEAQGAAPPPEEIVPLGEFRERAIGPGESQAWRVVVPPDTTVLVTVDQRSINLVVEARAPGGKEPFAATANRDGWGTEVLLLDRAGEAWITVRSPAKFDWPGRYTLWVDALPERKSARHDALALMSRAGREAEADTPDSSGKAEATYREALAAWRALGDRGWEAEALGSLAVLEDDAGDRKSATEDFLAVLAIWRELRKPEREASTLNSLGVIYSDTEEADKARETLEASRSQWRALGEPLDEAQAHGNLCNLDLKSGSLSEALACSQETLTFFRGHNVATLEAQSLNRIGGVYDLEGEPDDALASYQQALALWRTIGDRSQQATLLNNIAVVYRKLGEWQEALRFFDQSRETQGPGGGSILNGALPNNIGFCYSNLGQPQRALHFLEEALSVRRKAGDRFGEMVTLNNLGLAQSKLGKAKEALERYRQALKLAIQFKDSKQQAVSRLGLAGVDLDQGDTAAALRELEQALAVLRQISDVQTETSALSLRGRALNLAGRPGDALVALQEALKRHQAVRDRAGAAETLYELALAERSLGLATDARTHAETAVDLIEELRTGVLSVDLRAAFLATRRKSYSLLIDLLMDPKAAKAGKNRDRDAFAISERARARGLLDVLRAGSTASVAPPDLLKRRSSLLHRLSAKVDLRWKTSGPAAETLGKEIDGILADLDSMDADIRRHDKRFADFSAPKPISPEKIFGWLEPGTVLLEYSLGEKRSFLWAIEAGRMRSFVLPGQATIESLARQVYMKVSKFDLGSARRSEIDEKLAEMLLGPVWSSQTAKAPLRRLVVVPDGALALLPFAALPVPDPGRSWRAPGTLQPLVERLEVVSIPSATTLAAQRRRLQGRAEAPLWAAIFADPVFGADDERLPHRAVQAARGGPQRLERLPASLREANAVAALAPRGQVKLEIGLAANREAVLGADLRRYRIVHFATHALADLQNPELSGMVLSQFDAKGHSREGFLGLSDIYELDLHADLVVLSGCKTALGKEVRGEGLMGLTRGFQYAGVPRVVATLWPVLDRATAELMTRFYRAMWRDHLSAAAALREAQRSLRRELGYRNPYFWAGFVLQGDWR